jgi:hypothetical protein
MADPTTTPAVPATTTDNGTDLAARAIDATPVASGPNWQSEDAYWQSAYPGRPYARADRSYEYYRTAYRYGLDAALRYFDRDWNEVERELRRVWDTHQDSSPASWEEMSGAIRDAWDHVRGDCEDDRTHIR